MNITLPFTEAIAFATLEKPLPPLVESLTCDGSTVTARLDLREVPTDSRMMKLALSAGGVVDVTAQLTDFSDGIATLVVTAHARGLPAHKLLPYLVDPIDKAVERAGLPAGLVTIGKGDDDPEVHVDVQKAVDARMPGVTVTAMRLEDSVIHLEATAG